MKNIDYSYENIYKIKNRPLKPTRWSEDEENKIIEYTVDICLYDHKTFDMSSLEKYIIKELTDLKIILPDNNILKFEFFSRHWEPDDCSLYIKVYLEYNETDKQRKLRKQLEKSLKS